MLRYSKMSCDFNVPSSDSIANIHEVLLSLYNNGYHKVALNHTVTHTQLNKAESAEFKKTAENAKKYFEKISTNSNSTKSKNSYKLYTRLTVTLSGKKDDAAQIFSTNLAQLAMYDILAVAPDDFKAFQTACALDVDIIVVPASSYASFIRHSTVKAALDRGVHFEIALGPFLKNPDLRKNYFSNGSAIVASTGGRNILLSSGAVSGLGVRGAADLANLAQLTGLTPDQAHGALTASPRAILLRAQARASAKAVLRVSDLPDSSSDSSSSSTTTTASSSSASGSKGAAAAAPVKGPALDFIPFGSDETQTKRKGKRKAGEQ